MWECHHHNHKFVMTVQNILQNFWTNKSSQRKISKAFQLSLTLYRHQLSRGISKGRRMTTQGWEAQAPNDRDVLLGVTTVPLVTLLTRQTGQQFAVQSKIKAINTVSTSNAPQMMAVFICLSPYNLMKNLLHNMVSLTML